MDEKFKEILQARLTQEDVTSLFDATITPIAIEIGTQIIANIHAAAIRGDNLYTQQYGSLFPAPVSNGEVRKMVARKIVDYYNSLPDRLFDVTLTERQEG